MFGFLCSQCNVLFLSWLYQLFWLYEVWTGLAGARAVSVQTLISGVFTGRPVEVCEGHILIGHNYCQSCRVRKNWPVTAGDITVIITTYKTPPQPYIICTALLLTML